MIKFNILFNHLSNPALQQYTTAQNATVLNNAPKLRCHLLTNCLDENQTLCLDGDLQPWLWFGPNKCLSDSIEFFNLITATMFTTKSCSYEPPFTNMSHFPKLKLLAASKLILILVSVGIVLVY